MKVGAATDCKLELLLAQRYNTERSNGQEKVPGSFGLWFKSNCDLELGRQHSGEAGGSIHHVFFDGTD
jgi:hypothetical protein